MRKVAIIGLGQTPVREHWDLPIRHLGVRALLAAMKEAGRDKLDGLFVGNMLSGALAEQEHLGALIADYAGCSGLEAVKIEAACASGAAAFRQGVMAVASGRMNTAAVVGVEKLTEFSGKFSNKALATAADADYEASIGLSFAALNALIMQRYMHEFKIDRKAFSVFPQIAHKNACNNPNALFHYEISREQYLKSKAIAEPIHMLDSSPICDGAAAVIIVPLEKEDRNNRKLVQVEACEIATDTLDLANRKDPLWLSAAEQSVKRAYAVSGCEPGDIDLFELHDAFSIMSVLSLESSGFVGKGQWPRLAERGYFEIDGSLPVLTFGGLKARGHPVGATGVYQIVEAALQLRKEAPVPIQVQKARKAMTQNIGGSGATIVSTILSTNQKQHKA